MEGSVEKVKQARRKRRSREDVTARLREAARKLFAERGYAGTTTKEIARVADVSETLLFRYYREKAVLFDDVISAPFKALMDDFAARNEDQGAGPSPEAELRAMIGSLLQLVEANRDKFAAIIAAPPQIGLDDTAGPYVLEDYFQQAAILIEARFAAANTKPPYDIRVAASLAFGMIAAGVLLRNWLSPLRGVSTDEITSVLNELIFHAFNPKTGRKSPK